MALAYTRKVTLREDRRQVDGKKHIDNTHRQTDRSTHWEFLTLTHAQESCVLFLCTNQIKNNGENLIKNFFLIFYSPFVIQFLKLGQQREIDFVQKHFHLYRIFNLCSLSFSPHKDDLMWKYHHWGFGPKTEFSVRNEGCVGQSKNNIESLDRKIDRR